ncbi:MAG TPA: zinc dependent phospholipase C family protein [Saprospiraceae bacterium]|nr:zinc dependent phospholipase C family protein [Saprospiraceae bacterium]
MHFRLLIPVCLLLSFTTPPLKMQIGRLPHQTSQTPQTPQTLQTQDRRLNPPVQQHPDWGFFAHKRINRLATLTLPPEMMVFFKPNIDYLTDHAVDPDMRRYASKHEGPRHYIDLDNYGQPPYDQLPRQWVDAMLSHTEIWIVNAAGDTSLLIGGKKPLQPVWQRDYKFWFNRQVLARFYEDDETIPVDSLQSFLDFMGRKEKPVAAFYREHLSEHGVLPWNLQRMQRQLTEAFRLRDSRRILKLAADMGHYIGDAHVPLHTTSNYNGQKTGQHGIHGFWESRIPELFADDTYDYFVGKPEYVERTEDWFWQTVFDSNKLVDSVLNFEKALRRSFPQDRQMCPDMRLGTMVVTPCRDFAAAYQESLNNMIERRMRAAIHAVSSAWYTAWVDAGEPDLSKMDKPLMSEEERKEEEELRKTFDRGRIIGRGEDH